MKLLLVAATPFEIEPFKSYWTAKSINSGEIEILVTGVGMVATAFAMGRLLATKQFDLAINAGIAGAFDKNLGIGDVVHVTNDRFAELGAEDGEGFISIDELGFGGSVLHPIQPLQGFAELPEVSAITVNKVHGNELSISKTLERINPQIESMEGAAFVYACNQFNLPSLQIRSISNYVERRNRDSWNIPLAIKNLNNTVIEIINKLL